MQGPSANHLQFSLDDAFEKLKEDWQGRLAMPANLTTSLWSSLPTANHVLKFCEGLIVSVWNLRDHFHVRRSKSSDGVWEWEVLLKEEQHCEAHPDEVGRNTGEENHFFSLIPSFKRLRRVTLDENNRLLCSCYHFERCGYPCPHMAPVILHEVPTYKGFTHHDVCVFWWKTHFHFACHGKKYMEGLDTVFQTLFDNDISGPTMPAGEWMHTSAIVSPQSINALFDKMQNATAAQRLRNYSREQVERALRTFAGNHVVGQEGVHLGVETLDVVGYSQHETRTARDDNQTPFYDNVLEEVFDEMLFSQDSDNVPMNQEATHGENFRAFRELATPQFKQICSLYEAANLNPESSHPTSHC
jgi:hypothetical protein